jgi:hypothetical protein
MRWTIGTAAALLLATACGPPPAGGSHTFVVSHRDLLWSPFTSGPSTNVEGTITNIGVDPAEYTVELVASSGEADSDVVTDVLPGETGIWSVFFTGDVTVAQTRVAASEKMAAPVDAVAVITSQHPVLAVDAPGPVTEVEGAVTNTGATVGAFSIELQATSGEVCSTSEVDVPPAQTVPWSAFCLGTGTFRILRTTTYVPPS